MLRPQEAATRTREAEGRPCGAAKEPPLTPGLGRHLEAQHAQRGLEQHQGALVEKQVPEAEQQADVHHAGEGREEPVQRDERQLCGHTAGQGRWARGRQNGRPPGPRAVEEAGWQRARELRRGARPLLPPELPGAILGHVLRPQTRGT